MHQTGLQSKQKHAAPQHISQQPQISNITREKQLPGSRQACSNEEICPGRPLIWATDKHPTLAQWRQHAVSDCCWQHCTSWSSRTENTSICSYVFLNCKNVIYFLIKSNKCCVSLMAIKYQVLLSVCDWNHEESPSLFLQQLFFSTDRWIILTYLYSHNGLNILIKCETFVFWPAERRDHIIWPVETDKTVHLGLPQTAR